MTTKLTPNETAVMFSLWFNHYGEEGSGTWSWAVNESSRPSGLSTKSVPGVVGSLAKKGMVHAGGGGRDAAISMTEAGKAKMSELIAAEGGAK